jgi:hypothetical protein
MYESLEKECGLAMEHSVLLQRVSQLSPEPNPALLEYARQRAASVQNRIADQITAFAESMLFAYDAYLAHEAFMRRPRHQH